MAVSKKAKEEAKEYLQLCFSENGEFQEDKASAVLKGLVKHTENRLLDILTHFKDLVKLELSKKTARIESALELGQEAKEGIIKSLENIYGQSLMPLTEINQSLIGGFKVTIGSDVYDFSVKNKLNIIEESLNR